MSGKDEDKEGFEFFKLAANYLSDRFLQPLSAALLLSWGAWNYKILMILISFDTVQVKFENIKSVQARVVFDLFGYQVESFWWHGFILPIASALAFIYAYPYAATHALGYTLNRQRAVNHLKKRNSEEELVDVARGRQLIKDNSQLKIEIEKIKLEFNEKEKSLTETINILESNNAAVLKQLAVMEKTSSSAHGNQSSGAQLEKVNGSSTKQNAPLKQSEEPWNSATIQRIKDSDYIWLRVANRVYMLQTSDEFQVSDLFGSEVWNAYNDLQKAVIINTFRERFKRGEYINIAVKMIGGEESLDSYIVIPFAEYPNRKQIQDRVLAFIVSKKATQVRIEELSEGLPLRSEIIIRCLENLQQINFVKLFTGSRKEIIACALTSRGRLYSEALV